LELTQTILQGYNQKLLKPVSVAAIGDRHGNRWPLKATQELALTR
jgi:hypothetical protein